MQSMTSMPPAIIPSTVSSISEGTDAGALMRTMPASSGWPSASAAVSTPPSTARRRRPYRRACALAALEGPLGLGEPVVPARLDHVLDGGAVARKPGQLDREASVGERLGHGRMDTGLPVKPCSTSTPCGPPPATTTARNQAAPDGRRQQAYAAWAHATDPFCVRPAPQADDQRTQKRSTGTGRPSPVPPTSRRGGGPVRIGVDAVDRAGVDALLAARAQLRDDDHVHPVVEDRAELRRAVPDARVAVDADRHVDHQRRVLPLRVPLAVGDALGSARRCHRG